MHALKKTKAYDMHKDVQANALVPKRCSQLQVVAQLDMCVVRYMLSHKHVAASLCIHSH